MFVFGNHYAGGICEINHNNLHKIVPYLIVIAKTTPEVTVIDKAGNHHTGKAILVKPMVEHTFVEGSGDALHIFLAPYSAFAESLGEMTKGEDIAKLQDSKLPFDSKMSSDKIFEILDRLMVKSSPKIDPRLASALDDLEESLKPMSLVEIAERCEISPSRLRVIAKQQIGISLSTLLVWRKLVNAMKIMSAGSTLSEAATAAGFSDQAHFTRTMRKVFGVTPSHSMKALNYEN